MTHPTLVDVEQAGPRVYAHVRPTPLHRYPLLDEWIGCETWVKHENHHATGALKIRGGVNLVAQLSAVMRSLGAHVVEYGRDFDEAREHVEMLAERDGWRCVHSAKEPDMVTGVGTYALEIFADLPDVDYICGARASASVRLGVNAGVVIGRGAGQRRLAITGPGSCGCAPRGASYVEPRGLPARTARSQAHRSSVRRAPPDRAARR